MSKKAEIVIFRLIDKRVDNNSHFVNEDGTIDSTKKMDFTNTYGVLNPYFVTIDGVRSVRQFIRGCSFFDPKEQKEQGFVVDVNNSIVEFKAGGDIILDAEDDKAQIQWLKEHPLNTKSKYHKEDKHDKVFFTYDPKEVQKLEVNLAAEEDKAMEIVISLKEDKERLRAIGNLFEETSGLMDDDQIYLGLRRMARETPANFNTSIANRENAVLGDIKLAQKLTVITKDAKGYIFEGTEGVILETVAKGKDADNELVKYLMSKEGSEPYKQILVKIAQKQLELVAPAGTTEDVKQ